MQKAQRQAPAKLAEILSRQTKSSVAKEHGNGLWNKGSCGSLDSQGHVYCGFHQGAWNSTEPQTPNLECQHNPFTSISALAKRAFLSLLLKVRGIKGVMPTVFVTHFFKHRAP
jgi:hypothetical protein